MMTEDLAAQQRSRAVKMTLGLAVSCAVALGAFVWLLQQEKKPVPLPMLGQLPSFSFQERNGGLFGLEDLKGRVWVADFIFVHCAGECPMMTHALAQRQGKWKAMGVRMVSFTLDPRDTPKELKNYADGVKADSANWLFLTGKDKEVAGLAKKGFRLAAENDPASTFIHSNEFTLVDRQGRIRGFYDGLGEKGLQDLDRDLTNLVAEVP